VRALVTGGAGFIGSHLVCALVARGDEVRVIDNLFSGHRENLAGVAGRIDFVEGDIRDAALLAELTRGCALVFHQAAVVSVPYSVAHPEETCDVNIRGTLNVLQAARSAGAQRVLLASSAAVYGDDPALPKREDMVAAPISPYAVEKHTGELYARAFFALHGLPAVCLRYFNVFGPRQDPSSPYSGVISVFARCALHGGPLRVFGDGEQSRDFVFVADVVQANLLAAAAPAATGRVYNVGRGEQTTLNALLETLRRLSGRPLVAEHGPPRAGDIRASVADISRARAELGFAPTTSVADGLAALLAAG
jgi:UDP-glucose 4-epimerase